MATTRVTPGPTTRRAPNQGPPCCVNGASGLCDRLAICGLEDDVVAIDIQHSGSDALNIHQLIGTGKGPIGITVGNNGPGPRRSDALEFLSQQIGIRGIDIHRTRNSQRRDKQACAGKP